MTEIININIAEKSGEIKKILQNILSVKGEEEHIQAENICINAENSSERADILIIAESVKGEDIDLGLYKSLKILIVSVENVAVLKNIPQNIQIITCGCKEKDSFTFTSINEESYILILQRAVKNIYGETVLPFEFKAEQEKYNLKNCTDENILFAFCVYLCINRIGRIFLS